MEPNRLCIIGVPQDLWGLFTAIAITHGEDAWDLTMFRNPLMAISLQHSYRPHAIVVCGTTLRSHAIPGILWQIRNEGRPESPARVIVVFPCSSTDTITQALWDEIESLSDNQLILGTSLDDHLQLAKLLPRVSAGMEVSSST